MKSEKLSMEKFSSKQIQLEKVYGGAQPSAGTGECQGTGCSQSKGTTITDWEDIECGDTTIAGSIHCS